MPPPLARWPFYLESCVRVTCDVGYLCANFSLPRPIYSRLWPDVRDRQTNVRRQTDVRRASSLNASALWGMPIKLQQKTILMTLFKEVITIAYCAMTRRQKHSDALCLEKLIKHTK